MNFLSWGRTRADWAWDRDRIGGGRGAMYLLGGRLKIMCLRLSCELIAELEFETRNFLVPSSKSH